MAIQQGGTNTFSTGLLNGVYNFTTGAFKIALYTGSASLGPDTAHVALKQAPSIAAEAASLT
jgi:hypothetical protein